MDKKSNWQKYKTVLDEHRITKLYHFTDRDNLESIIKNGGLYSWMDCERKGIKINKPGGGELSRSLDRKDNLQDFVRVSFTTQHPMMYVAMKEGRISNPVILEIDREVIFWSDTKYADSNATRNDAHIGNGIDDFLRIHFNSIKVRKHFDLPRGTALFPGRDIGEELYSIGVYQEYWQLRHTNSCSTEEVTNQGPIYSSDYKKYSYGFHLYD